MPLSFSITNEISGLWTFDRPAHFSNHWRSEPGHHLHIIKKGTFKIYWKKRTFQLNPGDLIYYYNSQPYRFTTLQKAGTFYSIAFFAPELTPKHQPVIALNQKTSSLRFFEEMQKCQKSQDSIRFNKYFYSLLDLLSEHQIIHTNLNDSKSLWWDIEGFVRKHLKEKHSLLKLQTNFRLSKQQLIKTCYDATGLTPAKRIKIIKLNYAQNSLHEKKYTITEIAHQIGYDRVHEFSRDFKKLFNLSPKIFQSQLLSSRE